MKLLLTSNGLSSRNLKKKFLHILEKSPKETKVLVVVALEKSYKRFVRWVTEELIPLGISKENILVADVSRKSNLMKFKKVDVVYLLGGSTFYILKRLRKNAFGKFIKAWQGRNKVFMGISAGTIIAGCNIKIAEWGSEADDNYVHLKNLKGLNLTKAAIYVHYKDKLKKEIEDFKKIADYPVETVKDGEALLIINNKIRKIRK